MLYFLPFFFFLNYLNGLSLGALVKLLDLSPCFFQLFFGRLFWLNTWSLSFFSNHFDRFDLYIRICSQQNFILFCHQFIEIFLLLHFSRNSDTFFSFKLEHCVSHQDATTVVAIMKYISNLFPLIAKTINYHFFLLFLAVELAAHTQEYSYTNFPKDYRLVKLLKK